MEHLKEGLIKQRGTIGYSMIPNPTVKDIYQEGNVAIIFEYRDKKITPHIVLSEFNNNVGHY